MILWGFIMPIAWLIASVIIFFAGMWPFAILFGCISIGLLFISLGGFVVTLLEKIGLLQPPASKTSALEE